MTRRVERLTMRFLWWASLMAVLLGLALYFATALTLGWSVLGLSGAVLSVPLSGAVLGAVELASHQFWWGKRPSSS